MLCISVNYKKADSAVRGMLSFNEDMRRDISEKLSAAGADENIILCTCSRTEVYVCGNISEERVIEIMTEVSGAEDIRQYVMCFIGSSAVKHLFSVACGMDSMVIGEDEILGQTRDAFKEASDRGTVAYELNVIFQSALACAKKIKTDTSLSGVPVSTATLAANEAVRFGSEILLIGASGKIGSSTFKNILAHKNVRVTVTSRKHIPDIAEKYRDKVTVVPYGERYDYIDGADSIISATSSPVYTITYDRLMNSIHTEKKRLFIDLAVPRDIDERIDGAENIELIGIDRFEQLSRKNNEIKLSARDKAEAIISDELEALVKNMAMHRLMSSSAYIDRQLCANGIAPLMYKLKSGLNAEEFEKVINIITDTDSGKEIL